MDKEVLIKFADEIQTEFFFRLKDETQPAKKEFSYIDLLNILDIVYKDFGITKQDIEKYQAKTRVNVLDTLDPIMKEAYLKVLKKK